MIKPKVGIKPIPTRVIFNFKFSIYVAICKYIHSYQGSKQHSYNSIKISITTVAQYSGYFSDKGNNKVVLLSRNSYCNTTSQSVFVSFATHTVPAPTFKTEALRIVSNVQLVKRLLLRNEWQIQHYLALLRQ